jgi:GNAT superfamily N-acetyltransferase
MAEQCAALERAAFPTAHPSDLLGEEDILAYAEVFPEGFFVALDGDRVVGQGAGIFLDFDFDRPHHTIAEITGAHQCGNHSADGAWYYGTDLLVDPGYRRRGVGAQLYELRKEVVRRHRKKGIIAGGHMPGFEAHKQAMTAEEYIDRVRAGELYDPTLSFQIGNGFRLVCGLPGYLPNETTDGWAALIVWDNPEHSPN